MKYMILLLATALFAAGCTHTEVLTLTPDYSGGIKTENQLILLPPVSFSEGVFKDARKDTSMLASFEQTSHTYNLYSDRNIREILFDGISALVLGAGHTWESTESGDVIVQIQLLNVHASRTAGFVMLTAKADILIKIDFINSVSGDVLHTGVYSGSDERDQALVAKIELVRESIDAAIVDCINDIGSDRELASALERLDQ